MKKNRLFSLVLAVLMLLTAVFPMATFAEEILWDEQYEQEGFDENQNEEILVEQEVPFVKEYTTDENLYEETNDPANADVLVDDSSLVTEYTGPVVEDAVIEEKADASNDPVAENTEEGRTELVLEDTDTFLAGGLTVTDPEEQTVAEGATATFSVTASGGTAPYTYQWYAYTTKWVKTGLGGGTTASISFDALKDYDGRKFRCVVKDAAGATKTTAEALLTVSSELTVTDPEEQTVAAGGTATFSVTASGGTAPYTYQWYAYTTKWVKTGLGGGKTASISFDALNDYNGRKFRCVVTDAAGATKTTAEALLTVNIVDGDFVFKKIGDTNNLALIEYTGNASSIVVPGSVDNMTVTEIGVSPLAEGEKGVFEGNTTLTSVTLPNSITAIREKSFKDCTNLSTMTTY